MSGAEPAVIAAMAAEAAPAAATAAGTAAAGTAAAGAGAGLLSGTGTAGALGSGLYGIPLAEGAGSLIGGGGAVGSGLLGGSEAAGSLGSGLAGISMPTAAETTAPWWQTGLSMAKNGAKAAQTYGVVNKAMGGGQPAPAAHAAPMPFQGQPQAQIAPQQQAPQAGNDFMRLLMQRKNNGLLG